jgi:hypothetical protein
MPTVTGEVHRPQARFSPVNFTEYPRFLMLANTPQGPPGYRALVPAPPGEARRASHRSPKSIAANGADRLNSRTGTTMSVPASSYLFLR